ncbi:unnamed protein product [Calicophoron daubneyi]|uniref:Protein RFT1 homolog n=1 Tax=Calicophoron daubneyi TaxID=300641 RepID=A0AAV2TSG5_CALDB
MTDDVKESANEPGDEPQADVTIFKREQPKEIPSDSPKLKQRFRCFPACWSPVKPRHEPRSKESEESLEIEQKCEESLGEESGLSVDGEGVPVKLDKADSKGELPSTKPRPRNTYLSVGFSVIGYTFALQLGLHIMTFLLNGLAYRRLDTPSFGLVNVRIGLFYGTLMFVSRESFRRACLSRGGQIIAENSKMHSSRSRPKHQDYTESEAEQIVATPRYDRPSLVRAASLRWAELLDLAWLVLPVGAVIAPILIVVWIFVLPSPSLLAVQAGETKLPQAVFQQRYVNCLLVYALSGLFELSTEPFWVICQLTQKVRVRIVIEAVANTARAIGIVVAIYTVPGSYAIYILSLPQILHGTTLLGVYLLYFYMSFKQDSSENKFAPIERLRSFRDIFPRSKGFSVDQPGLELAKSLFGQGVLKQLLTEGERFLISAFHLISFTDQGIYDLVNNLGSTAARLIFLPMEESCHFVFNQCISRTVKPYEQDRALMGEVLRLLRSVLRSCSLIAWIGLVFAQANSYLLISIYAGPTVVENPAAVSLLRLYSCYVLLLAWNGSTEAFLNASMSSAQVTKHNRRLIMFSLLFLGANWLLVPRLGAHGFVLANCINMLCRIVYSCIYINDFLGVTAERHQSTFGESGWVASSTQTPNFPYANVSNAEESSTPPLTADPSFSLLRLMIPSGKETVALFASLAVTLISEQRFCCSFGLYWTLVHIGITALALCVVLVLMFFEERGLINTLRTEVFKRKVE